MVEPVNACDGKTGRLIAVLLALGTAACVAFAENLPDPTRPSGAAYASAAEASAPSGPVLQSVLHSSGRKFAVINGQMVKLGDMVGSARVTKIGDAEVVLTDGNERLVLKLFPVLEKQPSSARSAPKYGMRQ